MKQQPVLTKTPALMHCINKAKCKGYTSNFKVTEFGLYVKEDGKFFFPDQIVVNDCYRFNLANDPSENSILYLLETSDGHKGMLVNACDIYADPVLSSFIKHVEKFQKTKKLYQ